MDNKSRQGQYYKLPEITIEQINELQDKTGESKSGVITLAVQRMHQQELNHKYKKGE